MDPLYAKYNQIIATPPSMEQDNLNKNFMIENYNTGFQSTNNFSNDLETIPSSKNQEYVFLPTPVDPAYFEKLKQNKNSQFINLQNFINSPEKSVNFLSSEINKISTQPISNLDPTFFEQNSSPILNNNFAQSNPSIQNSQSIEKLITLQQQDYQKYFDTLNNIEYQKVYQNLNQIQLDQKIKIGDSLVDYNQVLNMDLKNLVKHNLTQNLNSTNHRIIDLPSNKKEIEEMYSKIFSNINKNNSFSFVQLNKDIILKDGKTNMYGNVDSKVRKIIPKVIGIPNKKDLNEKDYEKKENEAIRKKREQREREIEMDIRSKSHYPRFRSEYPHEKLDKQEMVYINDLKKKEFKKLKKKIEGNGGVSFIQEMTRDPENKKNLIDAVNHLIMKRNKEVKQEARLNLANCNRNCSSTCERASKLKHEAEEMCKVKCFLACSNNTLNNLLK